MDSTLAQRLKKLRGDMNQTEFGSTFGLSQRTVSRYETGAGSPDIDIINSICAKYGVTAQWLAFGIEPVLKNEAETEVQEHIAANLAREATEAATKEDWAQQMAIANDRLYQAWERERALLKENYDLRAQNVALEAKNKELTERLSLFINASRESPPAKTA